MTVSGFWTQLKRPILGLSPMDGITDAAFRHMIARHGKPDVMLTEFTNVEGLARGAVKMLQAFEYEETERPIVGQIYGVEVESFYKATILLCHLGFDGIDINMGCPANKVAKKGSGAGLIRTPKLAQAILSACQKASRDWAEGITLEEAGLHEAIRTAIRTKKPTEGARIERPVSVKTRIGYDRPITEEWIQTLLEMKPAAILLHGRTLKQMYLGKSDWEEIGKAARLAHNTSTLLLGNGDLKTIPEALKTIAEHGVDGALIGRATWGNPWFFAGKTPSTQEALHAAIEHGAYLETHHPDVPFAHLRKHLTWYCHDFPGAREFRYKLMHAENSDQLRTLINSQLEQLNLK